ncbi:MAG: permease [Deltaproteobacteria bacterium]|nr:permease [Deltaproteobacteria bacterium]
MIDSLLDTLLELSPWFLLGMAVAGLLHVALPRNFIKMQLRGRWGVVKAVALGVPLPLCSCGVIPAGLGLRRDGASHGASLGFLISTPQTGIDSILVSASFLGWPFALFKVLAASVTGLFGGILADRIPEDEETEERDLGAAPSENDEETRGLRAMLQYSHELLASIWRWLVFGIVVSALINTYLPVGTLSVFADLGPLAAGGVVLLISLPLYVCATASVPIAAAMVANGLPVGAALVFLMAGPATNIATIGAIYRGFGRRPLGVYLGVLIVGSIGFGALFDFGAATGVDLGFGAWSGLERPPGHHPRAWWAVGSALVLGILIARLALRDLLRFVRQYRSHVSAKEAGDELVTAVNGMRCGACVRKIEAALLELDGVISAVVTRNPDRAVVRGAIDRARIDQAILAAGYSTSPS